MQPTRPPERQNTLRLRPASFQTQLVLGMGLILALASLIALAGYGSLRGLQQGVQATIEEASAIRESSLQIENRFLLARQAEASFLESWRTASSSALLQEYVATNRQNLADATLELERLDGLVQSAEDVDLQAIKTDIDSLHEQLAAYTAAFQATEASLRQRSGAGGLDNALRGEMEYLEMAFEPLPDGRLYSLVLEIRANEQAYFYTGRQEYIDKVRLRIDDLIAAIEAAEWTGVDTGSATASKAVLISRADTYASVFGQIVGMDQQIDINLAIFREVTSDINAITSRIAGQSRAGLTRAQTRLEATGRRLSYLLGLTAIVALALGGVIAFVLGRRIVRPLGQLRRAAERMGSGELDQPVVLTGRGPAELVTLAETFNVMASRLDDLIGSLEQRVADRTRSLQAAAEVSHTTTAVLEPGELLGQVVELVRDRFDLYYVGLFLLDGTTDTQPQFATLRAGTGKAGQHMLAQGHRLEVGGESMIGWCIAHNQARIALDVGAEPVRFANPLLPHTRSEMALPLRSRGRVIGAMSVQSIRGLAFDEADVAVMQTMADQVAVAIDNARLFAESQAALAEMAATQRHYLGQVWREYITQSQAASYQVSQERAIVLPAATLDAEMQQAMAGQRAIVAAGQAHSALVAPILLRGQAIGVLRIQDDRPDREWLPEEMALLESVGERLSIAADNLRLLEESQRGAARERLTRELAARLRESLDVELVLDTAVNDIAQSLGLVALELQIGVDGQDG